MPTPQSDRAPGSGWRFSRRFWGANLAELLERTAFSAVRVVVPIYMASSEEPVGLHFDNRQKGIVFARTPVLPNASGHVGEGFPGIPRPRSTGTVRGALSFAPSHVSFAAVRLWSRNWRQESSENRVR